MNIAVRDVRVDPMLVKLCQVHGFNKIARKEVERVVKETAKRKYVKKKTKDEWIASMCPWPCYVEAELSAVLIKPEILNRIRVRDVVDLIVEEYGFDKIELISDRRSVKLVRARHIAIYLAKVSTSKSLPELGRAFGGKDHTTILHAVRKIERMIAESKSFADEINDLRAKLEGEAV